MSTRGKAAAAVASAGVLMIGWQIGTSNGQASGGGSAGTTGSASPSTSATSSASAAGSSGSSAGASSTAATSGSTRSGSFTGDSADFHYGTLQVTVVLVSGRISDVTVNDNVFDGRSQQINQQAIPLLRTEVLQANSANVAAISGATYTCNAYLQSLQSALDKAS